MDDKTAEASSASESLERTDVVSTPETADVSGETTSTPSPDVDESSAQKEPASLLEAVKAAAEADSKDGESPNPTQKDAVSETEPKSDEAPKDEAKKDEDPAKDEKLPFHKHPRWQEVLRERDSFKDDATQYRQITEYMGQNQLTTQEVAEGFRIMAAMKNDPLKAREMLSQYTRSLDEFAGVVLPQDLNKRVEEGVMDQQSAQELAIARNIAAQNAARAEQLAQSQQVQYQQMSHQAIHSAVSGWEDSIKTRDVDYAAKQNLVLDRARSYLLQGQPQTPEQALAIVEKAYADVNETLRGFAPRRQPVRPISSVNSSTNSQPVARSLQEAIRIAAGTT
jgi:hypothetical protein